ncbi:hypothetical protein U14_06043 [Candidatus Moduliflexus flocculans]|uniref:DUF4190 domain-containing protein n=1 Tax=Candidatus Moduliflexus flocculans TaxID=1499966 RepID=A0A081BTM4_9BACT|nr:hypothetical protein U14_06043 [Candidatus Moduliflexus flocculans]
MTDPERQISAILRCPIAAKRSLQWAIFLFPIWGSTWLVALLAVRHWTVYAPAIVPLLFARALFGLLIAALPIWFGIQGIRALKTHAGYSTGLLRSVLGISIGAAFVIVEIVTLFMVIAFMIQRNAAR